MAQQRKMMWNSEFLVIITTFVLWSMMLGSTFYLRANLPENFEMQDSAGIELIEEETVFQLLLDDHPKDWLVLGITIGSIVGMIATLIYAVVPPPAWQSCYGENSKLKPKVPREW